MPAAQRRPSGDAMTVRTTEPPHARTPPRRGGMGVLFLVLFLDLVGFSIVFPLFAHLLTWYGGHDAGLLHAALAWLKRTWPETTTDQQVALFGGLIGALYSLLQFITAPFWGRLSDRIGRRPVVLISLVGSALAYLLWVVAGSFALLLLSRFVAGAMGGSVTAANAAVADLHPDPQRRARAMGLVGMAFGLGFVLGPVIGGLSWGLSHAWLEGMLSRHPDLVAWGINPFSGCAAVAAVLSLGNLAWAWMGFRETLPAERRGASGPGERTANPLRLFTAGLGTGVPLTNAAFLLHTVLFAGMETTLVFLTAAVLAMDPRDNAWLFAEMGFVSAAIQGGVFRRLAPKHGARAMAVLGFAVLAPGFLLIALVPGHAHLWLLIIGVGVLAAGTGLVFPALSTLVSLASDARHQGLAMGSFRSAGSLGRAIGPLIAGALYFGIAPWAPYALGAVGVMLPLVLILRLRPAGDGERLSS